MLRIFLLILFASCSFADFRGWDHVVEQLRKQGISSDSLVKVYSDPRLPKYENIPFKLRPKESKRIYSGFLSKSQILKANNFIRQNHNLLLKVNSDFGVDHRIIVAILLVETSFGENTGKHLLIERLSRVCAVGTPGNIEFNLKENLKLYPESNLKNLTERAKFLEDTFCPELAALFRISELENISIFSLQGSIAGAFGIPQFMPRSYEKYALDYNKNSRKSLFEMEDAVASVANFLNNNGYSSLEKDKKRAILAYNNSEPYGEAILGVAARLGK